MSKHKIPFRDGSTLGKIFEFMQTKRIFTRTELRTFATEQGSGSVNSSVDMLLSPRETSERGDCRGNKAVPGHLYFIAPLARQKVDGVRQPWRFNLRWRKIPLKPRSQDEKDEKGEKGEKVVKSVKVAESKVENVENVENVEKAENKVEVTE